MLNEYQTNFDSYSKALEWKQTPFHIQRQLPYHHLNIFYSRFYQLNWNRILPQIIHFFHKRNYHITCYLIMYLLKPLILIFSNYIKLSIKMMLFCRTITRYTDYQRKCSRLFQILFRLSIIFIKKKKVHFYVINNGRGGPGDSQKWVPHDCSLYCVLRLPLFLKSSGWHLTIEDTRSEERRVFYGVNTP